jgi:hypothetical protein
MFPEPVVSYLEISGYGGLRGWSQQDISQHGESGDGDG